MSIYETTRILKNDCLVRVIRLRDHLGSAKALAEKLGISEQYLSDMINGRRDLSDELLEACGIERSTVYDAENGWKPGAPPQPVTCPPHPRTNKKSGICFPNAGEKDEIASVSVL